MGGGGGGGSGGGFTSPTVSQSPSIDVKKVSLHSCSDCFTKVLFL